MVGVAVALCWTLAPLSSSTAWWVRAFEFPRAQLAFLTAAMAALVAFDSGLQTAGSIAAFSVLLGCTLYLLKIVLPYTALFPPQMPSTRSPDAEHSIGVLVANVYMPNRAFDLFLERVDACDPDLILTLESDHWWESQLERLSARYSYSVTHALDNTYGMHLYSRLPLSDPQVEFLVEDDVPSIHTTVSLRSGHKVKLHCVHPAPPSPTENPTADERDAELLIVARDVEVENTSVIVTGDLNDVAWSKTTSLFQRVSGLLDPRIGRGTFGTFHARAPLLRWPLDHLFASADFTLTSIQVLDPIGSDHLPVHVVLSHGGEPDRGHQKPSPEPGDAAVVREKIARVDAQESGLA